MVDLNPTRSRSPYIVFFQTLGRIATTMQQPIEQILAEAIP